MEKRSILRTIFVIVVIAVILVLGFIFWNNYQKNQVGENSQNKKQGIEQQLQDLQAVPISANETNIQKQLDVLNSKKQSAVPPEDVSKQLEELNKK